MFEKNLEIGYLLDVYGDILPERRRDMLDLYYNDDLSLAEIAAEVGISRQGVRDGIKKAEEELFFLEGALHLQARSAAAQAEAERILAACSPETAAAVRALMQAWGIELNTESEGVADGHV